MISENLKKRIFTSVFLLILAFLVYIYLPLLIFILLINKNLSIIEFSYLLKKISKSKLIILVSNLSFILYLFYFV